MKRILVLALSLLTSLLVSACAGDAAPAANAAPAASGMVTADKSLVIYYSLSQNTQRIAERLAAITGADIYAIRTAEPYPDGYREVARISQEERSSGNLPVLVQDFPDLSGYSTIYLGGPIWNFNLPTPIESYLAQADFTGKRVIPFSTSMGSGQRGYMDDLLKRIKNPAAVGQYTDIHFPGNGMPNAFTDDEIDAMLNPWLHNNEVQL